MRLNNFEATMEQLKNVPGDIAEFGCFEGENTMHMASISKRRVWAWDTFSGMPDDGYIAELDASDPPGKWTPSNNPLIAFARSGFDIIPVVGKFSWTIPRFVDISCPYCKRTDVVKFAFVHIDCDHYNSYKQVLEFVTPRMSHGGIIRMDDLGCQGAAKAVREYCQKTGKNLEGDMIKF